MRFYVGLHQPSDARHFERCFVSINRLRGRRSLKVADWIIDSGAFTELAHHGRYRDDVSAYVRNLRPWLSIGNLEAVVAQDYMCEPWIIARTGLTLAEHQRLTIERYDDLVAHDLPVPVMPVLQGYDPADYVRHIDAYGDRLTPGRRVGVGSVCKRNGSAQDIAHVLAGIAQERPDLRLHGFGVKLTALKDATVRALLYSADSMAWSYAARREGRNQNDWREAERFRIDIEANAARHSPGWQLSLPLVTRRSRAAGDKARRGLDGCRDTGER
jgi:hypothetical protein